ncbi:MAG: thermonuclease family protein [Curvibacter sp.]|nr:MAG: thermonuclease family protein [Curvibacter sp.]
MPTWKHALLALLATTCLRAQAETITGKVVGVTDGDTVTVLDDAKRQHKIRLSGIDAPEKNQAFGQRSKESLSDLVFAKTVDVETDKVDRYGRRVGKIWVNGIDANLEQITRGMAWHYKQYAREQSKEDQWEYAEAEDEARKTRRALWREDAPVAPWKFRHNKERSGKKAD